MAEFGLICLQCPGESEALLAQKGTCSLIPKEERTTGYWESCAWQVEGLLWHCEARSQDVRIFCSGLGNHYIGRIHYFVRNYALN